VLIADRVIGEPGDDGDLSSLLEGVRAGRAADYERLVSRVRARVQRWAARFTSDPDAAEDIAQDVLIGLDRRVHKFDGRSRFSTWLFTVTRRVALSYGRREQRRYDLRTAHQHGAPETTTISEVDHDQRALANLVLKYFEALPPKQRQIFELVDLRGEEPTEVARRLGMQPVTVRANLFKARRAIRARMLAHHQRMLTEYES
jgi:RNA polymerase sigma-70 factor (ECF subfamily)